MCVCVCIYIYILWKSLQISLNVGSTHRKYIRENLWYNNRGSVLHSYHTVNNILGMLGH